MDRVITKYFEGIENQNFINFLISETGDDIFRIKALCWIAVAQAEGEFTVLRGLIQWGMDTGISLAEIYEILLQGHLFIGYPKALESFFILDEIRAKRGIAGDVQSCSIDHPEREEYHERGLKTARQIYAKNFNLVYGNIERLSPELAQGMIDEGYGRIISRSVVDLVTRELAIVSILTASNMPRQLYSHIRGAYNVGASPELIKAVIQLCRAFCPVLKVDKALSIVEKSLGNFAHPR